MDLRVLIVDDDMPTVEVIRLSVNWKRLGINDVMTAYNIDQAKKRLLETGADIVISDIEMPKGSGLDLLEWYRDQGMDGEFLLLTCHERFDYARNAVKLRASEYLLKPFDVNEMEAALERLIYGLKQKRQPTAYISYYETGQQAPSEPGEPEPTEERLPDMNEAIMDLGKLEQYLQEHKKLDLLGYIKQCITERTYNKRIDRQLLGKMRNELLQSVYTYLGKKGISVSGLTASVLLNKLEGKAAQSVTDFIRWANHLTENTFVCEEEMWKKSRLSDKIDRYIEQHYSEDISRKEIAAEFYLAPEYISKVYKKETGINLNDAIAKYRITQAMILLDKGEYVGDVAIKVGFKDFTYFSTTFKKFTGLTPNQYKRHEKG